MISAKLWRYSNLAAAFFLLHRRAWHAAIGTENAAVAGFRFQYGMTLLAFVEPLTGIDRHGFLLAVSAGRTDDRRFSNHVLFPTDKNAARQHRPDGFLDAQAHKPSFVCRVTKAFMACAVPFASAVRYADSEISKQ